MKADPSRLSAYASSVAAKHAHVLQSTGSGAA